jgi:hypothetical protein
VLYACACERSFIAQGVSDREDFEVVGDGIASCAAPLGRLRRVCASAFRNFGIFARCWWIFVGRATGYGCDVVEPVLEGVVEVRSDLAG